MSDREILEFSDGVINEETRNNIIEGLTTDNVASNNRFNNLAIQLMMTLASAVDAKDSYTNGHSVRVAGYSKEIAARMGKSMEEQEDIYAMGLLHDIGKIGIPDEIIHKKSGLSDAEYDTIKQHPIIGSEILKNVTEIPILTQGARWHHERYDGKGYPDGLKGEDIPECARIICVADAYDAMTSTRTYSEVRPQEDVRAEIEKGKGAQFDPRIADILIDMIDEDREYEMKAVEEVRYIAAPCERRSKKR